MTDRARHLGRPAVRENSQAYEYRPRGGVEQFVAPGDRIAEGLVARRQVAGSLRSPSESLRHLREQFLRRERAYAPGDELDRKGESIETRADLRERGDIRRRYAEIWIGGAGAIDKESDRGRFKRLASV